MAVLKCAKCGGEISSHAKKCPHCGATKDESIPQMTDCAECGKEFNLLTEKECPGCGAPKKIAASGVNAEQTESRGIVMPVIAAVIITAVVMTVIFYPREPETGEPEAGLSSPRELGEKLFESLSKDDFDSFKELWPVSWPDAELRDVYIRDIEKQYIIYYPLRYGAKPDEIFKGVVFDGTAIQADDLVKFREREEQSVREAYRKLMFESKEAGIDWSSAKLLEVKDDSIAKHIDGSWVDGNYFSPDSITLRFVSNGKNYQLRCYCSYFEETGWCLNVFDLRDASLGNYYFRAHLDFAPHNYVLELKPKS